MPSKSRNSSRKSTASSKSAPKVAVDEDGFPSVVIRYTQPTSRKTTPKSPRPEFLEPLSPTPPAPSTPWQLLEMSEADYNAMMNRVFARYREIEKESFKLGLLADVDDPRYWTIRMEQLERERAYFNKKRGWSAAELACVERIDLELEECEMELDRIYDKEEELEYECD